MHQKGVFSEMPIFPAEGSIKEIDGVIVQHLENISPSAMSRIFKRLRLHGIIERAQGTYKYFATAYGKEIIAAGLTVRNLVLVPALA